MFLAATSNIFGQDTTIYYLNSNWEKTKKLKATYIRKIIKYRDRYQIIETTSNNDTLLISELKPWETYVEHGLTKYYDKNSFVLAKGYYTDGYLDNEWLVNCNEHGICDTISYSGISEIYSDKTKITNEFIVVEDMPSFILNDTISGIKDKYNRNISETMKMMDGYKNEDDPKFSKIHDEYARLQMERTNNSMMNFQKYVDANLYYPIRSRKNGLQGTVLVQAVISPEGKLIEPRILKGVEKDLDFEALRLILSSPYWIPGKQDGKEIRVATLIPIKFKL